MSESKTKFRPEINGLRAIAVLAIFAFHINSYLLPGGFYGVDIFFVISGYLITQQILAKLHDSAFSFVEFYEHRIRRLLPALIPVLAACLYVGKHTMLPLEIENLAHQIASACTFTSNFSIVADLTAYFGDKANVKPLLHLWSLAVEEQFYLIWPIALFLILKIKKFLIFPFILLATVASFYLAVHFHDVSPLPAFYYLPMRMWELSIGALILFTESPRFDRFHFSSRAGLIGLACIGLAIALKIEDIALEPYFALLPCLGCALVIRSGTEKGLSRKILSLRPLTFVGLISYPLYLWHWPILTFSQILNPHKVDWIEAVLVVAFTIPLAALTHLLIEKPSYRLYRLKPHLTCAILIGLLASVGVCARWIEKTHFQSEIAGGTFIQKQLLPEAATDEACLQYVRPVIGTSDLFSFCRLADAAHDPTVALIGDSHANHLFSGVSAEFRTRGQNLINLGHYSCPPFATEALQQNHFEIGTCVRAKEALLRFLKAHPKVESVIIAFSFENIFFSWRGERLASAIENADSPNSALSALRALTSEIQAMGKKTIVIEERGYVDFADSACLERGWDSVAVEVDCRAPLRKREWVDALRKNFFKRASAFSCVYNSERTFNDENVSIFSIGTSLLYVDREHLSRYGSNLIAADFAKSECFPAR